MRELQACPPFRIALTQCAAFPYGKSIVPMDNAERAVIEARSVLAACSAAADLRSLR